jgi:hypothetical protein
VEERDSVVCCERVIVSASCDDEYTNTVRATNHLYCAEEAEKRTDMQHAMVQQEQQSCGLQDDLPHFLEEISTLRSLAAEAGVAGPLLDELEIFQHEVASLDSSAWERKEVRSLKRNELGGLSLAVLRAYRS